MPTSSVTPYGVPEATTVKKKRIQLIVSHIFIHLAFKTGTSNTVGQRLLDSLGKCLSSISDDLRETAILYQIISLLIDIFDLVAFLGSFLDETVNSRTFFCFVFNVSIFTIKGTKNTPNHFG